jgi:hypothetical protein
MQTATRTVFSNMYHVLPTFLSKKEVSLWDKQIACVWVGAYPLQLLQQFISFHEILYERYAIGAHSNLLLINLLQSVDPNNMADARTCEIGATLAPLNIGSWNDGW